MSRSFKSNFVHVFFTSLCISMCIYSLQSIDSIRTSVFDIDLRSLNVTGKDVTHRNGNPRDNRWSNLGLSSVKRNRSFARTKSAGKVNSRA